ncbi:hypothetical protein BGW42_007262 [Actinomortierella wolfii]|nr:hypothetical protein BGW42_007262 [Actinomortierella wolfii]
MSSNDSTTSAPTAPQEPVATAPTPTSQTLTAEQRNQRREELLKRQREAREKAQQLAQSARANATGSPALTSSPSATPSAPTTNTTPATTTTPAATVTTATTQPEPAVDAPVRENLVQQAVAFLSSPNVRTADEAKKTQFLQKKGLTTKEIALAKARVPAVAAGSSPAPTNAPTPVQTAAPAAQTPSYPSTFTPTATEAGSGAGPVPPPVPPRTYAVQPYSVPQQQQVVYMPHQQQVAPADPLAFRRKLIVALLISGGITALTGVLVNKLLFPMVRGITNARQTLAVTQAELLAKLKEKLTGYKDYLKSLRLGDSHSRRRIQKAADRADSKKTTVEEVNEDGTVVDTKTSSTTTTTSTTTVVTLPSTMEQLDKFSQTLERHAKGMTFEELKAVRSLTQDLAEYITKETYSLSSSLAYPTSRYYGYNTAGAAASGKGGLNDPTTPAAALKSEIRSLKGLLLNWRNFPTAKEVNGLSPASSVPNLVQQQ